MNRKQIQQIIPFMELMELKPVDTFSLSIISK